VSNGNYQGSRQQDRQAWEALIGLFQPVQADERALLDRLLAFASFLKYTDHDTQQQQPVYFDQLLDGLRKLAADDALSDFSPNGNMEPSQALIYATLQRLHSLLNNFNGRWSAFPAWYADRVLHVNTLPATPDHTYVQFIKQVPGPLVVPKETRITGSSRKHGGVAFHTLEPTQLSDIALKRMFKVYLNSERNVFPANVLKAPTALMVADLTHRNAESSTYGKTATVEVKHPVGLQVESPALLLREGLRHVDMTFESEKVVGNRNPWGHDGWLMHVLTKNMGSDNERNALARKLDLEKVFGYIFYLEISTADGWTPVATYVLERHPDQLAFVIKFDLPEDFSETIPCTHELHGQDTHHPALKILLNRNAWLYPLIWLEQFHLAKITIQTRVEGITNLQLYNELGRVDNAVSFSPFGLTNEKGAWFAVGNYEMAVKNTQAIGLSITWQQLPTDSGGLSAYYKGYKLPIDNLSFQLQARYLADYRWRTIPTQHPIYLFMGTDKTGRPTPLPTGRLATETHLNGIPVADMLPVEVPESEYHYGTRSKRGFISFVLDKPDMGFGNRRYRQLFTENMIKNVAKRKKVDALNPPISPLVERMLLSYTAKDEINLSHAGSAGKGVLRHIYPFGAKQVFPRKDNEPVAFVYNVPNAFNLMLEIDHVRAHSELQLFIDLVPEQKNVGLLELPEVAWYWGNGYHWEPLPIGVVRTNTTRNFLVNGLVVLRFEDIPDERVRDDQGRVWLCVSVVKNPQSMPLLKRIVSNVTLVRRDSSAMDTTLPDGFQLTNCRVPGISGVRQVVPFFGRTDRETDSDKLTRVAEHIAHRGKAVTPRDFERLVLQHFADIAAVCCLDSYDITANDGNGATRPGVITLVVFPKRYSATTGTYPYCVANRLLDIYQLLVPRMPQGVVRVDVINPVYEEIIVRARVVVTPGADEALVHEEIKKQINAVIAPWKETDQVPDLGHTFRLSQLDAAMRIAYVKDIVFTVFQLIRGGTSDYRLKRYDKPTQEVRPSMRHAVLTTAQRHVIGHELNPHFGIDEMSIDHNFVIYGEEE